MPYAKTFTSFEFEDFLSQLTPKRFELLRLARNGRLSIAELATAAHRDQSAVSRDVAKLSQLGLVEVEVVTKSALQNSASPHKHWVCAVSPTAPSPENQFTSH